MIEDPWMNAVWKEERAQAHRLMRSALGAFDDERRMDVVRKQLEAALQGDNVVCVWQEDGDGTWNTDCNQAFVTIDGTPTDNHMKFCPYCGHPLVQKTYEQVFDEVDDG